MKNSLEQTSLLVHIAPDSVEVYANLAMEGNQIQATTGGNASLTTVHGMLSGTGNNAASETPGRVVSPSATQKKPFGVSYWGNVESDAPESLSRLIYEVFIITKPYGKFSPTLSEPSSLSLCTI